ncbi:MAG TPA: tetratricopeptide repeat protein, partial [Blastocatellia bacterium]|nr:tetratricopeptide repeat protein [Blastocatellia bacterium]
MKREIMVRNIVAALALCFLLANAGLSFPLTQQAQGQSDNRAKALTKYLEAQRLEQAGNFPGAVAAYKEAIALDPASAELRVALGSLYLKSRNIIDAEAQAREAMKLAPDNLDVRKLVARVYLSQSFVGTAVDKEKARAAIKELEEIVKLDPQAKIAVGDQKEDEVPALAVIGQLYLALEEEDKALEALKRVSEGDSSAERAHYQLAALYYEKHKYREAVTAARKAYEINQNQPQYANLLAKSLMRIGRTQEALDIYKKAIGLSDAEKKDDSGFKEAIITSPLLFDYAEALVSAGRYDDAKKLLEP